MKIARQIRQGDVLLTPVQSIPSQAQEMSIPERLVLAEGEATGHAHAIQATPRQLEAYRDRSLLYLEVKEPVTLRHEEHAPLRVEPGTYVVVRQREIWQDEWRQVMD
jgi:hypothetical protein